MSADYSSVEVSHVGGPDESTQIEIPADDALDAMRAHLPKTRAVLHREEIEAGGSFS